jgi:hypothetical protein
MAPQKSFQTMDRFSKIKRQMRSPAVICLFAALGFCPHASATTPPRGDNFEAPWVLSTPYGLIDVDSAVSATAQPNEPANGTGHTVWFRWTAPQDGPVAFDTMTGYFPTVVNAYTGTTLESLAAVVRLPDPGSLASRTNRVRFFAEAGRVYHIQVDAATATLGRFVFKWWLGAPGNDHFADAKYFDSGVYRFALSSVNATKEPGEPNHAGNSGGRSVWIPFVGEINRGLTISTEGSEFDTLLAVYVGNGLSNLTEVASSDDDGTNHWSRVHFDTVLGTQYWIAVDGSQGDGGNIYLDIRYDQTPPQFTAVRAAGDQIELDMICNDDRRFLIESSTDLKTWAPWYGTTRSEYGELHFRVPKGTNDVQRFFRALQLREND